MQTLSKLLSWGTFVCVFCLTSCQVTINDNGDNNTSANTNQDVDVNVRNKRNVNVKKNTDETITVDETETHRERRRKKITNDIVIERQVNSLQRKLETDMKFEIQNGEIVNPPIGANIRITEKLKDRIVMGVFEMQQGKMVIKVTEDKSNFITQMYGTKDRWAKAFLTSMEGDSRLKGGGSSSTSSDFPKMPEMPKMPKIGDDDNF